MILPSKHIPEEQSLLGTGAIILLNLETAQTVSSLWEKAKHATNIGTYERYISTLNFLYIMGAIKLENGLIMQESK